jgi:hypothetical protein
MNRKERYSNDYIYENESVSDLVTIGSVVAVLADDDECYYYLMKISKVPFQLEMNFTIVSNRFILNCLITFFCKINVPKHSAFVNSTFRFS